MTHPLYEKYIMSKLTKQLILVAGLAIATAGAAFADGGDGGDNSMNPFTGESWAALVGGGKNLSAGQDVRTDTAKKAGRPALAKAAPKGRGTPSVTFHDNTGA